MNFADAFNAIEVVLWGIIGTGFAYRTLKATKGSRLMPGLAAVGFLAFAGSDAVEIRTGAWWRPWWLFVWKATCVVLLVSLAVIHIRKERSQRSRNREDNRAQI